MYLISIKISRADQHFYCSSHERVQQRLDQGIFITWHWTRHILCHKLLLKEVFSREVEDEVILLLSFYFGKQSQFSSTLRCSPFASHTFFVVVQFITTQKTLYVFADLEIEIYSSIFYTHSLWSWARERKVRVQAFGKALLLLKNTIRV